MKRRIFSSMMLLTTASLLAIAVILSVFFYGQLSSSVQEEVRERANLLKASVGSDEYDTITISDMRLTIIAPDGTVLYDDDEDAAFLPNHADREEVKEALASGHGESNRFSDTLGQETYYYAVKLEDGSILRVSKTTNSILGMFIGALPAVTGVVVVIFIMGYLSAVRLTKRIVKPINCVNLNEEISPPYEELAPFVGVISEQRKQILLQVKDLQNRTDTIAAIMDSMSEGIILIDRQGNILSVNKSAAAIFDITDSFSGKNILELIRDIELLEHVRDALAGNRGEMNVQRASKSYRVFFSPVKGSGAIILFLDVTEKMIGENLRREFSATVAHELRTPLTSIYGHAEMLYGGMIQENDQRKFFGKIKDEAARLIALIEDIILISELDESTGTQVFEDVNLAAVASAAVDALALKAAESKISVEISGEGTVSANPSMIYEMFYNLIDNAIKYNKPDGTVKIDIAKEAKHMRISVTDTGIGIPKEAQSRVFERFYRVEKSRSKKTGGTGLGLAIVKHIVRAHRGEIVLQSHIGEGTVVIILLPSL